MSSVPSNIRVFVTFKEDAIFAGEGIEATITFKNVERRRIPSSLPHKPRIRPPTESIAPSVTSQGPSRPTHSRQTSIASQAPASPVATPKRPRFSHRHTLSLNIQPGVSPRHQPPASSAVPNAGASVANKTTHGRSVSIVSFGSDTDANKGKTAVSRQNRPTSTSKLNRSASVQITPTRGFLARKGSVAGADGKQFQPGPPPSVSLPPSSFRWKSSNADSQAHGRSASISSKLTDADPPLQSASGRLERGFKFPPSPVTGGDSSKELVPTQSNETQQSITPKEFDTALHRSSPRLNNLHDFSRVKSPTNRLASLASETGTPRSSTEIYSTSNTSDDTLASEISSFNAFRYFERPQFSRASSSTTQKPAPRKAPESLMMGWAQVSGSFTLDNSLVNHGPFEEVKRKAVVGGRGGGGVVGLEARKQEKGFFGGFNFGSINSALSGMLGGGELSSIKEMKGIANSESIPLLSTPKSILFVDLELAPGESRSYLCSINLPRGIPPTHRGRAMKVRYQLIVGTQRSTNPRNGKQQVRQIEVPFRVLGGVNARGDILGHDLMAPYIILKDNARTTALNGAPKAAQTLTDSSRREADTSKKDEADFQRFVQHLLTKPRRTSSGALLSPSEVTSPITLQRTESFPETGQVQTRVLVDNAIRRSTRPLAASRTSSRHRTDYAERDQSESPGPSTSQTQFTIARAGQPLAQLVLSRPALRLGEVLNFVIDLHPFTSNPALPLTSSTPPVLAISLSLESSETIDPSLAIRSQSSVERATRRVWDRRVYGSNHGMGLGWCRRWAETLKVPSHATPTFETTGVSCLWVVRAEIVVGVARQEFATADVDEEDDADPESSAASNDKGSEDESHQKAASRTRRPMPSLMRSQHLLELSSSDERGMTLVAAQSIACESFEVSVPIKVFGTLNTNLSLDSTGMGEASLARTEGFEI